MKSLSFLLASNLVARMEGRVGEKPELLFCVSHGSKDFEDHTQAGLIKNMMEEDDNKGAWICVCVTLTAKKCLIALAKWLIR